MFSVLLLYFKFFHCYPPIYCYWFKYKIQKRAVCCWNDILISFLIVCIIFRDRISMWICEKYFSHIFTIFWYISHILDFSHIYHIFWQIMMKNPNFHVILHVFQTFHKIFKKELHIFSKIFLAIILKYFCHSLL